jgi:hypothetical protein
VITAVTVMCGNCGYGPIRSSTNAIQEVGTLFECIHCNKVTQPGDYVEELETDEHLIVYPFGHLVAVTRLG